MPPRRNQQGRSDHPNALTDPKKLVADVVIRRNYKGTPATYKVLKGPHMEDGRPVISVALWIDGRWSGQHTKDLADMGIIPYGPDDWNEGYTVIVPKP